MPIEIPEHLRYKAPVPKNTVGVVHSRYKEPKQYIDPESFYQAIQTRPNSHRTPSKDRFSDVVPRYAESKKPPPPPPVQIIRKSDSILFTEEYCRHKAFARQCGVSDVHSHWHEQPKTGPFTPRQLVEMAQLNKKAGQIKEGTAFKCSKAPSASFGELLESRELSRPVSPIRKGVHSVVMNWVNNGVPIPGHEAVLNPSPTRTRSPEKPSFVTGIRSKPKSPLKYSLIKEESVVTELCQHMTTAKTRSPPRVAYLPLKNQAPSPNRTRHSFSNRPRSNANNIMSPYRSPCRAHQFSSATDDPPEVNFNSGTNANVSNFSDSMAEAVTKLQVMNKRSVSPLKSSGVSHIDPLGGLTERGHSPSRGAFGFLPFSAAPPTSVER